MNDDKFYELVDDTVQELFERIPQHGETICCAFPEYNFPRNKERQFMEEVIKKLNEHYSNRYTAYWKNFNEGFYIVDKEWEKRKIAERAQRSKNGQKRNVYIEKGYEEI